jgi:hypothetical protein
VVLGIVCVIAICALGISVKLDSDYGVNNLSTYQRHDAAGNCETGYTRFCAGQYLSSCICFREYNAAPSTNIAINATIFCILLICTILACCFWKCCCWYPGDVPSVRLVQHRQDSVACVQHVPQSSELGGVRYESSA